MTDHEGEQVEGPADWQSVHDALLELSTELHERFGEREPSDEEVRQLLRERLLAQGRSADEADAFLSDL